MFVDEHQNFALQAIQVGFKKFLFHVISLFVGFYADLNF